jgi:hypothetical protein
MPQSPQLSGSELTSTQLEPHWVVPVAQVSEQTPPEQTLPSPQTLPHKPQLLALVCRFTHSPAHCVSPAWHWQRPA